MNVEKLKTELAKTRRDLAAARRTILQLARENLHLRSGYSLKQRDLMFPVRKSRESQRREAGKGLRVKLKYSSAVW